MGVRVVLHLLIVSGVVGRGPRVPLARHRDVVTTQGAARGYFAPRPPHYAFLGLPYARPPTHARFKAPKPPPRWDGVFEATHRIKCRQPDGSGVDDCLVVNVFAPEHAASSPVLVYIHDGGFQRGWGPHIAPVRLLNQGLVVVTFNYRLGPLGFLCLQTTGIPGNAGLKDQVAALYWVHRNIARFGGNPKDVTIYGTGSGGISVELLLLSELTTNLIHKAIIESGAVLSPSAISYNPYEIALAEAYKLGFDGGDAKDLELFYNKISPYNLVKTSGTFLPCIENSLLSSSLLDVDPLEILRHGIHQHVPLLISYSNAEELLLVTENYNNFNTIPESFRHLLPNNLAFPTESMRQKIADLVKDFYFEDYELSESVVQNYIDYINDIFMEYPITKSAMLHAAKSPQPVYLMKFAYKGSLSSAGSRMAGAGHRDVFKYIFSSEQLDGLDEVVTERLLMLWTNFIKLGDPTPLTTSLTPVIWQAISVQGSDGSSDIGKVSYLQLDRDMTNMTPEGQQLIFWDYIYEKHYKQHV